MIGELAILIKGLDSAFTLVKAGIDRKKDLDEMSNDISNFFKKKEDLEIAIAKSENSEESQMSSIREEQAIENHRYQYQKMLDSIGKEYSRQGRSPEWARIKRNAEKRQKQKEAKARQRLAKRSEEEEFMDDLKLVFKILIGGAVATFGILYLIVFISGSGYE
ncbi:MAG: hypothetical protein CMB25_01800 [Euryarchaeota archaeon]|nr:hypothetical protein [Euryarchaeota archaeon]|tara:strand:+ start:8385 stop:8873 length:489 start_codon:yes stop_codon:yes gene_type:complete